MEQEREEPLAAEPTPPVVTRSEGGLRNEREEIREQVKQSRELEPGSNLLKETAAVE